MTSRAARRSLGIAFCAVFLALGVLLYPATQKPPFEGIPLALAIDASNGLEMFLRIDTVQGDSADDKHKNEIIVDSYSMSTARPFGAKRPTLQDFKVTMPSSRATGKLFAYTNGGTNVPKAVLVVRTPLGFELVKWTFFDVTITSFQTVGNTHGDGLLDQITLHFGKAELEYRAVTPDGRLTDPVKNWWDQRSGKGA